MEKRGYGQKILNTTIDNNSHLHIQTSNHLKKGVEGRKAVVSRRARRER